MLESETEIHRRVPVVAKVGAELAERYGAGPPGREAMEAINAQAAKRVALHFVVRRTASWDHRKLAGGP
jgi:hypothetical protein